MISFELTEEQIELRKKFYRLAKEKLQPRSLQIDAKEPGEIDKEYLEIIAEENLNSFIIPEQYGGKPCDRVTLSLIMEELSYGCAGFAGIYAQTLHAVSTLLIGGSHEQKKTFLPLLLQPAGTVASFCVTEERSGSDTSSFATTAHLENDHFILNGSKTPIINAGNAAFYVVWANTDIKKGRAGINAFIIPQGTYGMDFSSHHDKFGLHTAPTATIFFKEAKVPKPNLIAPPGSGYLLLMQTIDWGRAFVGAIGVGLARAAIEESINYAKSRIILKRPIIKNQGISFTLSELATDLEAARLLVWKACRLMELDMDFAIASSMAKLFASELAVRATNEGMLILGQKGFIRPSLMDKYQRDAQALRILEGTSQIQKIIIAGQL